MPNLYTIHMGSPLKFQASRASPEQLATSSAKPNRIWKAGISAIHSLPEQRSNETVGYHRCIWKKGNCNLTMYCPGVAMLHSLESSPGQIQSEIGDKKSYTSQGAKIYLKWKEGKRVWEKVWSDSPCIVIGQDHNNKQTTTLRHVHRITTLRAFCWDLQNRQQ